MKTKIITFSAPDDYDRLVDARKRATGMTRSEYFRKCIREEAERAVAKTMDVSALLVAAGVGA